MTPLGLLNIYKPAGLTSRQVVSRIERLVRPARAGHAGTLDPLATGVLIVCVGNATRLIEYVQRLRKRYRAEFQFGVTSPTDDIDGELAPLVDAPRPTLAQIQHACPNFIGRVMQRPPNYSAIHVAGKRAYKLARAGKDFELAERPVDIYSIDILAYEYPSLTVDIECGSGTYIRSFGRDLASTLGTVAVMTALERTAIGSFTVAESCPFDELTPDNLPLLLHAPPAAVSMLPRIELSDDDALRIRQGQLIRCPTATNEKEIAAFDSRGDLIAVLTPSGDGIWRSVRVMPED